MKQDSKTQKKAAALKYDPQKDGAPVLTAAGAGLVADRIIEAAQENDVPVVHDEGLAGLLSHMPVGREIPPELYRAVAEILVFISRIDEKYE